MKKVLTLIFIGSIFSSCVYDRVETIRFLNKSDSTIYMDYSCSDRLEKSFKLHVYQDATINGKDTLVYSRERAEKDSIGWTIIGFSRKGAIRQCKDKKLRFFFIKESVMKGYSWEEICEQQLYEKKLVFTEEELVKMNWTVVYE